MSFNAIRENKILAKISEFTVALKRLFLYWGRFFTRYPEVALRSATYNVRQAIAIFINLFTVLFFYFLLFILVCVYHKKYESCLIQ